MKQENLSLKERKYNKNTSSAPQSRKQVKTIKKKRKTTKRDPK